MNAFKKLVFFFLIFISFQSFAGLNFTIPGKMYAFTDFGLAILFEANGQLGIHWNGNACVLDQEFATPSFCTALTPYSYDIKLKLNKSVKGEVIKCNPFKRYCTVDMDSYRLVHQVGESDPLKLYSGEAKKTFYINLVKVTYKKIGDEAANRVTYRLIFIDTLNDKYFRSVELSRPEDGL